MNRMHTKGEKGFTLVELLIVFTLLAVLAAIMIPNVSGLVSYGHAEAAATELSILQTSMDAMMAKASLTAVNATSATTNMAAFPLDAGASNYLYPNFLRKQTTKGTYSCDITGNVTQTLTGYE
jgi:prepilin-type N-terminal cleavage/methylation domain-containing protein